MPTLHAALRIVQMFWYVTLSLAQIGSSRGGQDGGQTHVPRSQMPPFGQIIPAHMSDNITETQVTLVTLLVHYLHRLRHFSYRFFVFLRATCSNKNNDL